MQPSSLDSLLLTRASSGGAALAGGRWRRPGRSWRCSGRCGAGASQAVWVFSSAVAMVGLVAAVLLALRQLTWAVLLRRAPLFALLWLTAAVCAWGAPSSPRAGGCGWWAA